MEWTGPGIVLRSQPFGEAHALLDVFTEERGSLRGLLYGGMGRRHSATVQPGNTLMVTWRVRSSQSMGQELARMTVEPLTLRTAVLMQKPAVLYGLTSVVQLLRIVPEGDPHPHLYKALLCVLEIFDPLPLFAALMARFELLFLAELGFGLDWQTCPVSGAQGKDLVWVSPKTGRAVSAEAGMPYAERLFSLPSFLLLSLSEIAETREQPSKEDLLAAFRLTRYFLTQRLYKLPSHKDLPSARLLFLSQIENFFEHVEKERKTLQ